MQLKFEEALSVSEFNLLIRDVLSNLGTFRVKGEITEFNISQNQGLNITLSDGKSNLRVGGYVPFVRGIDLVEKDMDVIVEGIADFYIPYGTFALKAISIEPLGEGALAVAYQNLKEKLEREGLFAIEHKKPLPEYIDKIALLTGKDSAAYSDFIKILKENNSSIEILFYPVIVQGVNSVNSIKKALMDAKKTDVDVIVLSRGGGSLEDLKSFNSEELARFIFSCPKPVIVGVGHEKDESICDFVADVRASTPSQAAYYIVAQNKDFVDNVIEFGDKIGKELIGMIEKQNQEIDNYLFTIEVYVSKMIERLKTRLDNFSRILKSYNIKSVLKRGFAIVQKGKIHIKSVKKVIRGDRLSTIVKDGKFYSIVE